MNDHLTKEIPEGGSLNYNRLPLRPMTSPIKIYSFSYTEKRGMKILFARKYFMFLYTAYCWREFAFQNRSFPSCLEPYYESEGLDKVFIMKSSFRPFI